MKVYIHQVPGRIRIRTEAIKKNPDVAEAVGQTLLGITGIRACRINRYAGSIVIHYDTHVLTAETIQALCQKYCLLKSGKSVDEWGKGVPNRPEYGKAAVVAGELFGKAIFNAFVQQTVERSVFSMVTAVLK